MGIIYECVKINFEIAPDFLNDSDKIIWNLQSNGNFSVKSAYNCRNNVYPVSPIFVQVWKLDVRERVKVLIWLMAHNKFITRELCNSWFGGYVRCHNCPSIVESSSHVCRGCLVASVVWNSLLD